MIVAFQRPALFGDAPSSLAIYWRVLTLIYGVSAQLQVMRLVRTRSKSTFSPIG